MYYFIVFWMVVHRSGVLFAAGVVHSPVRIRAQCSSVYSALVSTIIINIVVLFSASGAKPVVSIHLSIAYTYLY